MSSPIVMPLSCGSIFKSLVMLCLIVSLSGLHLSPCCLRQFAILVCEVVGASCEKSSVRTLESLQLQWLCCTLFSLDDSPEVVTGVLHTSFLKNVSYTHANFPCAAMGKFSLHFSQYVVNTGTIVSAYGTVVWEHLYSRYKVSGVCHGGSSELFLLTVGMFALESGVHVSHRHMRSS